MRILRKVCTFVMSHPTVAPAKGKPGVAAIYEKRRLLNALFEAYLNFATSIHRQEQGNSRCLLMICIPVLHPYEARTYRRRLCVARSVDGGQCEGLRYAERADGTAPTPYLYICTNLNNNSSLFGVGKEHS